MLTTERKKLVTLVTAKVSGGDAKMASGFVVSPGRVLTAAHTFGGRGAKSDIQICLCDLEPSKQIPARLIWPAKVKGGEGFDVAILEFDPGKLSADSRRVCEEQTQGLVSARPPAAGETWECYGLPEAGDRIDRKTGKAKPTPIHWQGPASSVNPGGDIDLTAWTSPDSAAGWQGASGTAVFIGGRLCAIVLKAHAEMRNMLVAQWLGPLLGDRDFVSAIGWSPERGWLHALVERIHSLLTGAPEGLRERLGKDLKLDTHDTDSLTKVLTDLPAVELLLCAGRVGHALVGDGAEGQDPQSYEMAGVLEKMVEAGLAEKLGAELLTRVSLASRAGASDGYVELPCMQIVLAECYCAGLDGRSAGFRSIPPDDQGGNQEGLWKDLRREYPLWPEICVPLSPAVGFDEQATGWPETALDHLARALGVSEIQRSRLTRAERAEMVNDKLATLAMAGQAVPKRWYLVCFDGKDKKPLQELRDLLPELRICTMSRSNDREERRTVEQLATLMTQFLDRKRKRENRQ
jgi:hypothetical protein